ncbi:MAG TPA: TetR/AcrR family transcriptional regulator [Azospirillaceae bacterium]|nr:TetR/AcrR family transcriptional regulator [Azospirillaceae bacterium]
MSTASAESSNGSKQPREPARGLARGQAAAEASRAKILDGARAVFLEHGFAKATMDLVAEVAGVSKQTVYNRFGDKDTLFRDVIGREAERNIGVILETLAGTVPATEALARFGEAYIRMRLSPENLALHRVIVGEVARFPELAREVQAMTSGRVSRELSAWLSNAAATGRLALPDEPEFLADVLMGAWSGAPQQRAVMGADGLRRLQPEERARRVLAMLGIF